MRELASLMTKSTALSWIPYERIPKTREALAECLEGIDQATTQSIGVLRGLSASPPKPQNLNQENSRAGRNSSGNAADYCREYAGDVAGGRLEYEITTKNRRALNFQRDGS